MSAIKTNTVTFLLLAFVKISFAQASANLLLNKVTTREGLSSNEVKCIYQDSRGFIWIGTYDGLNRYDGKNIKVYRKNISDTSSLISNWITNIVEDKAGNLWIGTAGGVSRLNKAGDGFTNFSVGKLFPGQKCTAGEQKVFKDNFGKIWVCSGGLSCYNEESGRFVPQPFIPPSPVHNYRMNQLVFTVTVDKNNDFWMGTLDGLYRYTVGIKKYTRYDDNPPADIYTKHGDILTQVNILNENEIAFTPWENKIYILNTAKANSGLKTVAELKNKIDIRVFSVEWNGKKEFWAVHNEGIVRFDAQFRKIEEWQSANRQTAQPEDLTGSIKTIYQSKEKIIFLGTTNGVVIVNPYLQLFKTYHFSNAESGVKYAGKISCVTFDASKILAGAIYSNALYEIDSNWHVTKVIKAFSPVTATEASTNTYECVKDTAGIVWFATFQGLVKLNPKTLRYTIYLPPGNDPLFYRHKRFVAIQNSGNKIWLANYKQDILCFDKTTCAFKIIKPFNTQKDIWSLMAEGDNIWFTSGNTLVKYNSVTSHETFFTNANAPEVNYQEVIQGKKNELWLTSTNGIWRYNTQTGEWRNWNTNDGLCNDYVGDILFDKKGNLWVATSNGIAAYDTTRKIFYNFNSQNGLPYDDWSGTGFAINNTGTIFLGNDDVITYFNPGKVIRVASNYPAYITGCQVNGSEYPLPAAINGIKKISLNYNENNINFQFTVVNLLQPFQTSYYYKLEGFDKDWHLSPTGTINYTNLYADKYVLRVSSNPLNNSAGSDALFITVNSPFWEKWWFVAGVLALTGLSTVYAIRRRIRLIRKEANRRAEMSQQVADLRMKALRSQMNPHFLFNSLNAIQECCITGQTDIATQYLARFSKLVRYILENSGKQWISLKEEIEIIKLYLDVESLRFTNSFAYSIENRVQVNDALIKIPPMLVQPFAENAIWHGLLHKNGERHVWIRFYNDEEKLYVEVEDNGVGRGANKSSNHAPMGMGIVEERVKLIEEIQRSTAAIEVIDKKDALGNATGTIVKLKLPML